MANMAKTNKLSKIFVVLLFVVVAATLTFAFVNVPNGAANADEPLVLEGQTADYIVTADENLQKNYDVTTNTYTAPKGMDSVIVLKVLAPASYGTLKFKFDHGALASGYGLDVYFSLNGDDSFEINDGDEDLLHIAEIHAPEYKLVEPDPSLTYENDIVTINQLAKDDVIKIKFHNYSFGSLTISGLKMNEQEYSVTAKIEGEAHGTVSIGDDVTSADKDSVSANIKEGHTATFTVQPDDDYYAFWQDSTGKVVGCENSFTTDMIFAETNYIVRFEKYVSAGSDGQAKITYDSTLDETADFGWKKSDTEGRYELTDIKHFATGNNVHASAPGILTLTLTFDGEKVVSFDYLLERAMQQTSGEIIEYPVQLLRLYFIVDGEGVTTDSLKAEPTGEEEFWSEPYNYKFEKGSTGLKETAAVTDEQAGTGATTSIEAMIKGEGHHKVEFVIVSMLTTGIPFYKDVTKCYVENIQVKDPTPHTFTLDYDDNLGNIIVTGAKKGEGNSWTGYDGFPITFEASTTEVESSLDKKTQVPTHFINWTVGDSQPTDTTLNLMFKDGKLTYGDKELTANEVKALFQEETIKPTAFRQISKETSDTQQITDGEEVKLPINEAPETQLRLITAGFGKENEAVTLKVNGANASLQTVKRNDALGELGDLLTEEILSEFNKEVQELKWWVQPNLGKQLVLEVAYTCDGYFGESVLTMYLTYTADAKELGLSNNSLNNVFTSDSEDGAYITTSNSKGEGDELWSATNEWEGDNGSIVFENNLHNINNLEQYSPGITSGQDRDKVWYYSYVRIGISQNGGAKRKGVLMFDIRLDITGGNGDRKGAVVVERRDHTASNGPEIFEGTDVDYTPTTGLSYKDGTFNRSCITSVLEYTNKTQIWGMNNPYVTDLGDGWYRCAFPTVRECEYLSEDDSYTHDTLQYFISFGFSGDVSARYAIRNMTFRNGTDAEFKFNANEEQNNGNVTAKVGESPILSGQTVAFGSRVELTATATEGQKFYGWEIIDKAKKSSFYASTSVSGSEYKLSYTVLDPVTVVAWFGNDGEYEARVGGHFYATLDEAVKATNSLGTADIVIIKDKIHLASDLEIPAGISLILPFSDEGLYFGSAASNKYSTANRIAWADGDETENRYLTFFIDNTATLTVKGNFFVGGVVNHVGQGYQGHTSGAYAEVINNGHIVIQDKGVMDVYGRVRGTGDIDVQSGDLKQPFLILDFMGGTETLGLFMDGVTPFKRYAMINIECKFTIHYGARLVGHATLYALNQFISLDQAFIGMSDDYGRDTMIMLKDGAYVTATYDPNKVVGGATSTNCTEKIGETTLHFYGGAWFSYMQFTAMGLTVPTSGVFFSIPYNYNLQLDVDKKEVGTYETKTDFMIMPGAVVHVCEKAKLILHSNAWIYDGFEQATVANKSYPTASDLESGRYSKSGNLIVDGTLEIQKKFGLNNSTALPDQSNLQPAIFVGLVQTTSNTGKIVIDSQAILTFRPFDGTEGSSGGNYFAYNSTARVWDAAHGCFADLEAGKTYTAVKGKEGNDVTFTLDSIKYTNTKQSETDELPLTLNQQMHGSWMEVHGGHNLDWNPNAEKDGYGELSAEKLHKLLHRQCSVMGCDYAEDKELLYALEAFEDVIYKGEAYTDSDLLELLKKMFKDLDGSFAAKFSKDGGAIEDSLLNVPINPYQITVTLTNAYWLVGEKYEETNTLKFNIEPFEFTQEHTGLEVTQLAAQQYTGNQLTVDDVNIKFKGQKLEKDKDYRLEFGANINATDDGTVTVKAVENSNFTGSFTLKFDITPVSIEGENGKIEGVSASYSYTGSPIEPGFTVKTNDKKFTLSDGDYDVTYDGADHTNARETVTLTVTGKGNFGGSTSVTFEITPKELTSGQISVEVQEQKSYVYSGKPIAVKLTVKDGETVLTEGEDKDYTIQYSDGHTDAGSHNFTVTLRGNYEGSTSSSFTILAKDISGATVTVNTKYTYDRTEHKPQVGDITVSLEGFDSVSFQVKAQGAYGNNINAGTNSATVTIQGTRNFTGEATGMFDIAKATISGVTVSNTTYSGTAQKPALTVMAGGLALTGDEYTATYMRGEQVTTDFTNAGDIKITVTANSDNFQDGEEEVSATYTIAPKSIADANITVEEKFTYNREAHTIQDPGKVKVTLAGYTIATKDFDILAEYGNNTNAGKATFTIQGKGNFTGTATGNFTIEQAEISGVTVNGSYTYNGTKQNISLTVMAGDLTLTDDEYTADFGGNNLINAAENITVTVTPGEGAKANIKGQATNTFSIAKKDVTVTINKQTWATYNGTQQNAKSDAGQWSLKAGSEMANGQQPSELGVTLAASGTDAKSYDITPTWSNTNYNVTFEGEKGAFVINKANVKIKAKDVYSALGDDIIQPSEYEYVDGTHKFFSDEDKVKFEREAELKYTCDAVNTEIKTYPIKLTIKAGYTMDNYIIETPQDGTYHVTDSIFAKVTFNGDTLDYDAKSHTLTADTSSIKDQGVVTTKYTYEKSEGSWEDVPSEGFKDVGTYKINVHISVEGHTGTQDMQATLTINPKNISNATVTVSGKHTYTGKAIVPTEGEISVSLADWTEEITFDAITATENTNAGTANVSVTGNGNYKGTAKGTFAIDKKSIAGSELTVTGTFTYNGEAQTPKKNQLTFELEGFDYNAITFEIKATDNVNATTEQAKAHVTVTGTGNFEGTLEADFVIGKAQATLKFKENQQGVYGTEHGAPSYDLSGVFGEDEQTIRATITVANEATRWSDIGKYNFTVSGEEKLANYTLKVEGNEKAYTVTAKDLDGAKVSVKDGKKYTYTGEAILPKPEEVELTLEGYDNITFELSSSDNVGKGTKTLTVKGTGNYTGTTTGEFEILPAEITGITLANDSYAYDNTTKTFVKEVFAGALKLAAGDYDISYKRGAEQSDDLKSAGTVTVTVTAKEQSNFAGEYSQDVTIEQRAITVTLEKQSAQYSKSMPAVNIHAYKLADGDQLPSDNIQISLAFENEEGPWNVGKYKLVVKIGNPNYKVGTLSGDEEAFEITKRNVTIKLLPQDWAIYNGATQQASSEAKYWSFDKGEICEGDDLQIQLSVENAKKANVYALSFAWNNENYNVTRESNDNAMFTIAQKPIDVTVLEQTSVYNAEPPILSQEKGTGWSVADGAICKDGDKEDDLGIRLSASLEKNVGNYKISADWTNKDYKVTFNTATKEVFFKVTPATITITVQDAHSTYGDARAQLEIDVKGICESDSTLNIYDYVTIACEVNEKTGFGTYDITCTKKDSDPANYVIDITNTGTYTVNKKDVTVTINNQDDVYDFQKGYKWNASAWTVDEKTLANGEKADVLKVKLAKPELGNVGTYAITATYDNNSNYNVTFKGDWAEEDGNKGKAGVYTISKQRLEHNNTTVLFILLVNGEEYQGTEVFPYVGEDFELTATVWVTEGDDFKPLDYTIDPAKLSAVNVYTVTVTINDANYEGSRQFTVEVVTDDGFSQNLKNVLAELERIVGDVTKDTLSSTQEHFEMIKKVEAELAKLTDTDKELGAAKLAKYEELVETWHDAANISDEVIETAKTMADSPIKWLFALAEMSILLAAMYVIGKGGLM